MKKMIILFCALIMGTSAFGDIIYVENNVNMDNFWEKTGRAEQKITDVGYRIMDANSLKRSPIHIFRMQNLLNAWAVHPSKDIYISMNFLNYIENDDELAAILSHEIAHSQEYYKGFLKIAAMNMNKKNYEFKADLYAIDYMVKAGYNPIAAITVINKIAGEPLWDWGFTSTHPKGSRRLLAMYKYIYLKYPQYLNSSMTKKSTYQTFLKDQEFEIKKFEAEQNKRKINQNEDI